MLSRKSSAASSVPLEKAPAAAVPDGAVLKALESLLMNDTAAAHT